MDDLFSEGASAEMSANAPLAVRMRPAALDDFVGQERAVGEGTWLRRAIEADELTSIILYGPPGSGKTSLACVIAGATAARFVELSAVASGVQDLRRAIDEARDALAFYSRPRRTILFIDEIHRFSRNQQDALLHAVEDGLLVLVGATTENPFFEVNAPLVSRSRVIELSPLTDEEVRRVVRHALVDSRGLGGGLDLDPDAEEAVAVTAGGDARVALSTLELAASAASDRGGGSVTLADVRDALSTRSLPYDKQGDTHYDVVSAFIKSMRGSDPDAAVYWLARMVHGGEDPRFIARRMMILASEDIGAADPESLLVAHAAFKAAESIGWPECRIVLAHAAIHLALAPKSNSCYLAIEEALEEVRSGPCRGVPFHLRDRHRPGAEGYAPYLYPPDHPGGRVEQMYLPEGLEGTRFYRPSPRGREAGHGGDGRGDENEKDAAAGDVPADPRGEPGAAPGPG